MNYLDYQPYVVRLARRLIRYRRSGMIDENDLVSAALTRLWQVEQEGKLADQSARVAIKYAMLEVLRGSGLLHSPRSTTYQKAMAAYGQLGATVEPSASPVEKWIEAEPVREVQHIIQGYPRQDQLLLSLIWEQGCSLQEAAEVLDLSKTRVHQRYGEIIRRIRSQLLVDRRKSK
ncbi:sigma-70 family RNA polymerase sigma factor [Alicyclobacillaceae bacterium I2511]|nr:sigma-70 family RNA polymerase sigma factor [Alicyclobacillaceae bacterium I2511]